MIKKILILAGLMIVFLLGLISAPERALKYDQSNVKGYEYGFSSGSYLLQGSAIQVKRIFTQPDLTFLEEADGTIHLYVKKDEPVLFKDIRSNQNKRFHSFRCFYYNFFLHLIDLRNSLLQFVEDLIGQDAPLEKKTQENSK